MRKALVGVTLLAFAATIVPVALAAEPEIKVSAELFARAEYLENFTDFTDTTSTGSPFCTQGQCSDDVDFGFYRNRLGVEAVVNDGLSIYFEIQNHGNWGQSAVASNAQDPVLGNLWLNNLANNNTTILYQGYVDLKNIGGSPVSVKFGRMEKTLGNELHIGDADFYSGQFFDGIDLDVEFETWTLDVFYFYVTERNLLPGALGTSNPGGSDDSTFWGLSTNIDVADGHNIEPYLLYKRDGNEEGNLIPPAPKYSAATIGVLYQRPRDYDSAPWWNAEFAMQKGDIGVGTNEVDLSSYVFEGEFGWSFGDEQDAHHSVSIGGIMLGDGDDATDIEGFMPLYPDTHRRLGMADVFSHPLASSVPLQFVQALLSSTGLSTSTFRNVTSVNVGWDYQGGGMNSFGAKYHQFTLTEDFGASEDDLGSEIDLWWNLEQSENFNLMVGLADFMPGDLFEGGAFAPDDDVLRFFAQGRFRM